MGRVKDIYKNDKGETIAPQRVEKLFGGVPGIKGFPRRGPPGPTTFSLSSPRRKRSGVEPAPQPGGPPRLPRAHRRRGQPGPRPYERVVNFALLDRDFTLERGRSLRKGSFNRKILEQNFSSEIEDLYRSQGVNLARESFQVWIPRWFPRPRHPGESDRNAGGFSLEPEFEFKTPGKPGFRNRPHTHWRSGIFRFRRRHRPRPFRPPAPSLGRQSRPGLFLPLQGRVGCAPGLYRGSTFTTPVSCLGNTWKRRSRSRNISRKGCWPLFTDWPG